MYLSSTRNYPKNEEHPRAANSTSYNFNRCVDFGE